MIVQIRPFWRLASECHQWVVQKGRIAGGRERWDGIAHCRTLDSAIAWLRRHKVWPDMAQAKHASLGQLSHNLNSILSDSQPPLSAAQSPSAGSVFHAGDGWRLERDALQWIVQRRRRNTPVRWDSVAYHRQLDMAVRGLVETRIRLLDGHYSADALIVLCRALDRINTVTEHISAETCQERSA